tara:strand:- start:518 stop:712 length:195 start_codon:yes stop_codon:yes gene_type:complete
MGWMKFVHQVYVLGDEDLFVQKVYHADKAAKKSIKYKGEIIDLNRAKAIAQYLKIHNFNDLFRR